MKVNEMVKKLGVNEIKTYGYRDSDGDGVANIIDCKPYDKKRQGMVHTLGAKVARKFGKEETAKKIEARGEHVDAMKEEARKAGYEEEKEQAVKTAKYKEQMAGKRKREYYKSGGWVGAISRTADGIAKNAPRAAKTATYKPTTVSTKPKKKKNIVDFKLDMPKFNF